MAEHAALIEKRGPSASNFLRAAGSSAVLACGDVAFLITAGQAVKAVNFLVSRGDFIDALCVAAAIKAGRFEGVDRSTVPSPGEGKSAPAEDAEEGGDLSRAVCCCMAQGFMLQAQPHYAAATMLSAGRPSDSVVLLARGWELEAAFGLATAFAQSRGVDGARAALLPLLAARAQVAGDRQLSLAVVREAAARGVAGCDVELHAAFLASDPDCSEDEAGALLSAAGLSRGRAFVDEAAAAEGSGDAMHAARCWLLAQRHAKAAGALGLALEGMVAGWDWRRGLADEPSKALLPASASLVEVACLLRALEPRRVTDDRLRSAMEAWSCWVGGQLAGTTFSPLFDLRSMAAPLFQACRRLARDADIRGIPPSSVLLCAEAGALLHCDRRSNPGSTAVGLVSEARDLLSLVADVAPGARGSEARDAADATDLARAAVQRLGKLREDAAAGATLDWEAGAGPEGTLRTTVDVLGPVMPFGCLLPSGKRAAKPGLPPLSRAEAVMWEILVPNFPLTSEPAMFLCR